MMNNRHIPDPRVSMSVNGTVGRAVNDKCHSYTGGVKAGNKHVMRNPRVMVILWGRNYITDSSAASFAVQLISDLVTGPFMNGLVQYGIGRGSLAGQIFIDTNQSNPAPASLNENQVQNQLNKWIDDGIVPLPRLWSMRRICCILSFRRQQ